jgi:molybdopterin converting factor small subunit
MQIRFFKPFSELAGGEEIRLVLENPISVRELWGRLEREIPPLQRFVKKEGDEVQSFFAVIVRGDEILKLDDTVGNEDVVKILPPISGG